MTYDDVIRATSALKARREPVTVARVQAELGGGAARSIRRHLSRLRREAQVQAGTMPRAALTSRRALRHSPAPGYPSREAEAADLDTFIAVQRAAGLGSAPAVPPPPVAEDEEPQRIATRWERREHYVLVCSLLDEAVPWLRKEDQC